MMANPPSIPWSELDKVMTVFNGDVMQLNASKDLFGVEMCERTIPRVFKDLHEIIHPALVNCGQINSEKDLVPILIEIIGKMQTEIYNQVEREVILANCLELLKNKMI